MGLLSGRCVGTCNLGGIAEFSVPWFFGIGRLFLFFMVLPPWNTAENTSQFLISKASIVISGKAAPLFGQVGGEIQWWIGLL